MDASGRLGVALVGALLVLGLIAALGGAAWLLGRVDAPVGVGATLWLAEALGDRETSGRGGFARAVAPRPFAFPADHGSHPDYRTEWWYYTGNLETTEGRHFGFQLTFFRTALAPRPVPRRSAWGATQVYTAHLALTDVAGRRFRAFERASREAIGLAGATGVPFRVWLDDWAAEGAGPAALPMRLRATQGGVALDLSLGGGKAPVLQGERGLSRKGAEPGNASYYYSLTRMPVTGTIGVGDQVLAVRGLAWMDREWSTSALGPDQVGWDWFALQLGDGRELMSYRLRRTDGTVDPMSQGTLVRVDGSSRSLPAEMVAIEVLGHWTSPRGGTRYPSRWRVRVPEEGIDVEVVPYLADQELDLAVRYWEGAVRVHGAGDGSTAAGAGYVELVGYAGSARGWGGVGE